MADGTNIKRVSIFLDTQAAQLEYTKLEAQQDKLTKKIADGTAAGKNMVNALKQLDTVNANIKKVQDQMDKGLKPSIQQQTTLVTQLRNELKRLSESDPQFTTKVKNFQQQNAELQKMQKNVAGVTTSNDKFGISLEHLVTRIAEYVSIYAIFNGIKSFLTSSVELANKSEQAFSRLQTTLQNIGRLDAFERLKTNAEDLSKEFGTFRGDDVVEVFQKLITYGKLTENQIKELTPVIIDLAAHQKIDLSEATDLVVKSLEGNNRGLKTYGINIKEASTVTGRFGVIMDDLKPKVEGAAKAFGETTQGQIKKTEVEIDNLKEEIGTELQPAIKGFYATMASALEGLKSIFANVTNFLSQTKDNIILLSKVALDYITFQYKAGNDLIAQKKIQLAQQKEEADHAKELANADAQAKSIAVNAAKETIAEQEKLLSSYEAVQRASLATYVELKSQNKLLTDEGKKASSQLIQDTKTVQALKASIAAQTDKRVLGNGNPDFDPNAQKALDEAAKKLAELKKQAEDFLKSLNDEDFLAKVPNDFQAIAEAAKKYFADIKTLTDDFNKNLISVDEFNKGMAQVEEIYKDKIHDLQKDDSLKLKPEVVPEVPTEKLPSFDQLYHMAGFLTPAELKKKAEDEKNTREEIAGYATDALNEISNALSSIEQQQDRNDQRRVEAIDKNTQFELSKYRSQLATKQISNNTYLQKEAELNAKADLQKEAIARKEFERQKRVSEAQIIINSAEAALKLWAQTGVLAPIAIAALAATTAIELGIVALQHYAEGGTVQSGEKITSGKSIPTQKDGDNVAIVAKRGEVILNEKQQAALGGPSAFAAIGVPGFAPAYKSRPYMAIDTAGITDTYHRLHYASGGIIGTGTQQSINNDPEFKDLLGAILNHLQNPVAPNIVNKVNIPLKLITDAMDTKARIQQNAILQ